MTSCLTHLECPRCDARYDYDGLASLCICGSPLFARYDAARASATLTRQSLPFRPRGLWRFAEMLPPIPADARIELGEGSTPTLDVPRLAHALDLQRVWIKDESPNPTGSFKARGLAMAVSVAHHAGARAFGIPSAGNAGVALAAYAARAGATARVVLPRDVPKPFIQITELLGAEVTLVDGLISDAAKVVAHWREAGEIRDVSTLREPWRVEGKKTMGYEIAESFPDTLPDVILYPTGGGTGIIGIWKAFAELRAAGWFGDATRPALPRMVAVQTTGCAPIVRAFEAGADHADMWEGAHTCAAGLRVPRALGDREILAVLRESRGTAIAVTDDALIAGTRQGAALSGLPIAPEGGALIAAAAELRAREWLRADETVLLLNTGSAHLYLDVL